MSRWTATVTATALVGWGAAAAAQDWKGAGRVEGRVLATDGTPIAGATVKLDNPGRGGGPTVKTDKKGKWAYLGLVGGAWNVDVEAAGFVSKKLSMNVMEAGRVPPVEITLEKAGPPAPPPELVEAIKKSDEAYKAGRFEEALGVYEKLLAMRPDLATLIHQQMGFALIQLKRQAEALDHLQKVLDAEPQNMQIRAIMAQAALEGGLIDRGVELLKGLDPSAITSPDVFFNIGVNFINADRPEEAITYFGRAIALDAAYADGYFRRGLAYLQLGKMAEAKADLAKVIELTPTGPQAD
ncbi:MAG TPA: tetratricopeptide repeat protein, partial [Vicinamibacteria bacterium]